MEINNSQYSNTSLIYSIDTITDAVAEKQVTDIYSIDTISDAVANARVSDSETDSLNKLLDNHFSSLQEGS